MENIIFRLIQGSVDRKIILFEEKYIGISSIVWYKEVQIQIYVFIAQMIYDLSNKSFILRRYLLYTFIRDVSVSSFETIQISEKHTMEKALKE